MSQIESSFEDKDDARTQTTESASAESLSDDVWKSVKFHGEGREYFKIWIINLFLSIITLGVYSAWATVRTRRYFSGSTEVEGARFDFHGKPLNILFGRIISLVLLLAWTQGEVIDWRIPVIAIVLIVVLFPLFYVKAMAFRLSNTSWRNIRFRYSASILDGYKGIGLYVFMAITLIALPIGADYMGFKFKFDEAQGFDSTMIAVLIVYVVSIIFMFAVVFPIFRADCVKLMLNKLHYADAPFTTKVSKIKFLKIYWKTILTGLIFLIVGSISAMLLVMFIRSLSSMFAGHSDMLQQAGVGVAAFCGYLVILYMQIMVYAVWRTSTWNHIFQSTTAKNQSISFKSDIKEGVLTKVAFTNALMMILTLGFAYPWAKVRMSKLMLESIQYKGDLNQLQGTKRQSSMAIGEEVGDAFDLGFGI